MFWERVDAPDNRMYLNLFRGRDPFFLNTVFNGKMKEKKGF